MDVFYLQTIIISVAVGHCKSHAGDVWITDQKAAKVFPSSLSLPSGAAATCFVGEMCCCKEKKSREKDF